MSKAILKEIVVSARLQIASNCKNKEQKEHDGTFFNLKGNKAIVVFDQNSIEKVYYFVGFQSTDGKNWHVVHYFDSAEFGNNTYDGVDAMLHASDWLEKE